MPFCLPRTLYLFFVILLITYYCFNVQVSKFVMDDPNVKLHYDQHGNWKIETVDKNVLSPDEINTFAMARPAQNTLFEFTSGVCEKCGRGDSGIAF